MTKKLSPVVIASKTAAKRLVDKEERKRAVVAINDEGKLVVCSRRTARKHAWEIQDVMYKRKKVVINDQGKMVVEKTQTAAKKTPQRRSTDKLDVVMVPRQELEKVKDAVDKRVEKLLDTDKS